MMAPVEIISNVVREMDTGNLFIVKEMNKEMNYGVDQLMAHKVNSENILMLKGLKVV